LSTSHTVTIDKDEHADTTTYAMRFLRPGTAAFAIKNSEVAAEFSATADTITMYLPDMKQYTANTLPMPVPDLIAQVGQGPMKPSSVLVAEAVREKPFSTFLDQATDVNYVGKETDGHHVSFLYDDVTWHLWIADGEAPLPVRFESDMAAAVKEMKDKGVEAALTIGGAFSDWSFEAVDAKKLAFAAPEGAKEVSDFGPQPPANDLLGKLAPDFTLPLSAGGDLTLSKKAAGDVIVLDFWATWCGPCRQAMPIIDRVTKSFADKGVRLYAVNLQETVAEVQRYLKEQGLDVNVAFDKDGGVAEKYKADSIPETVIIGQDGTVQVVHVGLSPALEQELTRELTVLVKGEKLAK
jgi:thiol-disulfide isomerase/thioredoxin